MLKSIILKAREKINFQGLKAFNFKKYSKILSLFLILIIIGLAFPKGFVHAGLLDIIGNAIWIPVYAVFWILFALAHMLAIIGATILNIVLNPAIMNNVFGNPAIYGGWSIIRDICNLLFLLLMLLVAFGTIVQSQKYNIKNSLPKLLFAIFLINFSNVIAGAIIDFGNILMYGILDWVCTSSATCFSGFTGGLLSVVDIFSNRYGIFESWSWTGIDSKDAIGLAIATVYTFVFAFLLMALAAFLLVRTAALALLLILAPFAYFGEVMPGMEKVASKWWDNIWSYTLFGPIFALMLYISGEMAKITIDVPPFTDPELGFYGPTLTTIIANILPLLFLMGIIPITKTLGLAGTDTIIKNTTGLGENIAKYAGGVADRFAARGAQPGQGRARRALSYFSPGAWKRAIKAHNIENEHDYNQAAGKMREKFVQPASDWGHKSSVKYEEDMRQKDVAREAADIRDKTKDEKIHLFNETLDDKGRIKVGLTGRAEALLVNLATTSDANDVYTKLKDKDGNFYENTPEGFVKFMDEKFRPAFGEKEGKEDKTGRLMAEIAQLEKKDGHYALKGTSEFKNGEYSIVRDHDIREKKAAKEVENSETQKQWQNKDSRTTLNEEFVRDSDGKVVMVQDKDEIGRVKKDKEGNDVMVPKTLWQTADRGVIEIANMTDEVIESVWKSKPKHQKRMLEVFRREEEQFKRIDDLVKRKFITQEEGVRAKTNMGKLRMELEEAVYGTPRKKKQQGNGMGVGQVENQLSKEEQDRNEERAREDEEEERRRNKKSGGINS